MEEIPVELRAHAVANAAFALAQICFWTLIENGMLPQKKALRLIDDAGRRFAEMGTPQHLMAAKVLKEIFDRLHEKPN